MRKRNVTITLDEETARWVRVEAAKRDTSVSRLVADVLREYRDASVRYEDAMERYLSRPARSLKQAGTPYPSRDEVHDRAGLR